MTGKHGLKIEPMKTYVKKNLSGTSDKRSSKNIKSYLTDSLYYTIGLLRI